MNTKKTFFLGSLTLTIIILLTIPLSTAAHYIVGFVNDSLTGVSPNDYTIIIWNQANGITDNLTDTIGTNGNSGASNIYFLDCELLNTPCTIGDQINAQVINNGSGYTSQTLSITVTGSGFDVMPNITLNSKPNMTLLLPTTNSNTTGTNLLLSCTAGDLDNNLQNTTLYGTWNGGWHANQTISTSGSQQQTNFTKTLNEGTYNWNCQATDNLSISSFAQQNYTFTIDNTPPIIYAVGLNISQGVCGTTNTIRVTCEVNDSLTGIDTVLIRSNEPSSQTNHTTQLLTGNTYYTDITINQLGNWNFTCIANDTAGNTVQTTSTTIEAKNVSSVDLTLTTQDIILSNENPIENTLITINATIHNEGCSIINNANITFYEGNPSLGGQPINTSISITVPALSSYTTSTPWQATIGPKNLFVTIDPQNTITELNETNNQANKSLNINAWQELFGKITLDKLLGNNNSLNLSLWYNETTPTGSVFVADTESNIDWNALKAIGRNTTGQQTNDDFNNIDTYLNMTSFNDSVTNTFTTDGNTPLATKNFLIHQQLIPQVPIVNSTNNENFYTGILWDTSDDTDGEYGGADKEDLIFAVEINKASQGAYGTYDYELRIPVQLRTYNTFDQSSVYLYYDLN